MMDAERLKVPLELMSSKGWVSLMSEGLIRGVNDTSEGTVYC